MASVYETATETFTITRLRAPDATVFSAAIRAPGRLPNPIAVAQGPLTVDGPGGAVGAGESWGIRVSVPAVDMAWVLISADYQVYMKTGVGTPVASYLHPRSGGSHTSSMPPDLGLGANLTHLTAIWSGGTYVDQLAADTPAPTLPWVPIPPSWTVDGFDTQLYHIASAGAGFAIDDIRLRLAGIRFLGFPINVWDTGLLWEPASQKGS